MELVRPTEMGPPTVSSRKHDDKSGLVDHPGVGGVRVQIHALRRRVAELEAEISELRASPNTPIARYEKRIAEMQQGLDWRDRRIGQLELNARGVSPVKT